MTQTSTLNGSDAAAPARTFDLNLRNAAILAGALIGIVALGGGPFLMFLGIIVPSILVHEGGHLVAAKRAGMGPTEFFAGFGPKIFSWRGRDGVEYGLKAIPAGGYVKIPGMTPTEKVDGTPEDRTYRAATRPRRLAVVLAGVAVNAIVGVTLLAATEHAEPTYRDNPTVVEAFTDGARSGWAVTTGTVTGLGSLVGDLPAYLDAVVNAGDKDAPEPPARFLSPIGASNLTEDAAAAGWVTVVRFAAIINLSLAVFNLLPFLPLDGGHAVVVAAEGAASVVSRRKELRFNAANRWLTASAYVVVLGMLALSATAAVLDIARPVGL